MLFCLEPICWTERPRCTFFQLLQRLEILDFFFNSKTFNASHGKTSIEVQENPCIKTTVSGQLVIKSKAVADLREASPYSPKCSQFHAFFWIFLKHRRLAPPPGGLAPPPTENPGSAPCNPSQFWAQCTTERRY